MRQRIITGILFALTVAVIVLPGYWQPLLPIAFFALVAYIITNELRQTFATVNVHISPFLPLINAGFVILPLLLSAAGTGRNERTAATVTALTLFTLLSAMLAFIVLQLIRENPKSLPDSGVNALLMSYVAFPLSCPVIILMVVPDGFFWMVLGLATPWISDTVAFFTGTLIGRHKIVPHISPKKTVEGSVGGVVGTILVVMLFFWLVMRDRPAFSRNPGEIFALAAAGGALFSIASQMGDWLASAIKRWCGIKDFGNILPGHGGILDRFDSVLFTMPVALAMSALTALLT